MPLHKQVTTCRKTGGQTWSRCSCEHCTLAVCSICGAYEGGLTTDCPGTPTGFDRQKEVYETLIDYTDEKGWHQGAPMEKRSPRFEEMPKEASLGPNAPKASRSPRFDKEAVRGHAPIYAGLDQGDRARISSCACGWKVPAHEQNSDTAWSHHVAIATIAPIDWARISRESHLHHELSQKAIAWVLADRLHDDHDAALTRVEDEIDTYLKPGQVMDARGRELHEKLEYAKMSWRLADQRLRKCDEELRQAARALVEALEK